MSTFSFESLLQQENRKPVFKTFEPWGDLIVCDPIECQSGRVILPQGVADPFFCGMGKVIAAGPDCKKVKEGDVVLIVQGTQGWTIIHGQLDDLPGKAMVIREGQIAGISLCYGRRAEELKVAEKNGEALAEKV